MPDLFKHCPPRGLLVANTSINVSLFFTFVLDNRRITRQETELQGNHTLQQNYTQQNWTQVKQNFWTQRNWTPGE